MKCIKTGCCVFVREYRMFYVGDSFMINGVPVIRINNKSGSREPVRSRLHHTVYKIAEWFDRADKFATSTLLADHTNFINHGENCEGVPV